VFELVLYLGLIINITNNNKLKNIFLTLENLNRLANNDARLAKQLSELGKNFNRGRQ
jgi:hypothetical protein